MTLIDTVKLVTTSSDGYGDRTIVVLTDAKALFVQRLGTQHNNHSDGVVTTASVYLDTENSVIVDNLYRLEGMHIIAPVLGQDEDDSWYKITSVTVAQRKLIDNTIDNIHCQLEKVAGIAYVS